MTEQVKLLKQLQEEQRPWQRHNFPDRPSWIPLMGAVEEIGELVEALCRQSQYSPIDVLDAIGDVTIYLADYCSAMNFDIQEIWDFMTAEQRCVPLPDRAHELSVAIGIVAHAHVKTFQEIRRNENHHENARLAIGRVLLALDCLAVAEGYVLQEVAHNIWQRVKQRDWQKNRDTAHQV